MRAGWTGAALAALVALGCATRTEPAVPARVSAPAVPAASDCSRTEEAWGLAVEADKASRTDADRALYNYEQALRLSPHEHVIWWKLYEAIHQYRTGRDPTYLDVFWGLALPNPLPAAGAKVTVTGRYGSTFTKSTSGVDTDDVMGVLTYEKLVYLEPSKEPATLPGLTLRPPARQ